MNCVNKPRVSKGIAWSYGALVVFIGCMVVFFAYAGSFTPLGVSGVVASAGSAVVGMIIFLILRSLYNTRYIVSDKDLTIETTKLIGGCKRVRLNTITSIEKTLLPLGFKLFGASFHGGYYSIPALGRAFLTITNFEDGLLFRTNKGNYIITPKDPGQFKEDIEKRMRNLSL
jgi:hypothetical protein